MQRPIRRLLSLAAAAICLLAASSHITDAAEAGAATRRILVKTRLKEAGKDVERIAARAGADRAKLRWSSRVTRWHVVEVDEAGDPEGLMSALRTDPSIESVEPDRDAIAAMTPDDLSIRQWALENVGQVVNGTAGLYDADIDAPEAWDLTHGDRAVVVAVLDTGVHADHPDLEGNLVPGYDFANGDGDPWDDAGAGHGTPVAGIIGAVGDNGTAMAGVNWSVSLMPVKVCEADGVCPYSVIVEGIEYAVARGARVINMSFTCDEHQNPETGSCGAYHPGSCRSEALLDSLRAAGSAGVLAVTSAGNCGADLDDETKAYPCSYDLDNMICVASTDARDEMAPFSNHGPAHVGLAAPGAEVLSLSTHSDAPLLWDGTSFSAPLVTGVAALQLARNATLTPRALAARMSAADPLPSLAGYVSRGARLNAHGAVRDLFLGPRPAAAHGGGAVNLVGDFNGDGMADLCEASAGGGYRVAIGDGSSFGAFTMWSGADPLRAAIVGDFDGDGMDDIARVGRRGVEVMISSGTGFGVPRTWAATGKAREARAADLDGDGRSDIALLLDKKKILVALSDGSRFSRAVPWESAGAGRFELLADLTGDGRADLVRSTRDGLEAAWSTGVSFGPSVRIGGAAGGSRLLAGDVDGDGDADLLARDRTGCWNVMLSDGGRISDQRPWTCAAGGSVSAIGMVDADARADLVTLDSAAGWQVHLSRE